MYTFLDYRKVTKLDHVCWSHHSRIFFLVAKPTTSELRYFSKFLPRTVQSTKSKIPQKIHSFQKKIDHGPVCEISRLPTLPPYNTKKCDHNQLTNSRTLPLLSLPQSVHPLCTGNGLQSLYPRALATIPNVESVPPRLTL